MLDKLIVFSLHNRLLVLLLGAILIGAGVYTLVRTPVDAFPDTTPVQVQINTVDPALNPGASSTWVIGLRARLAI